MHLPKVTAIILHWNSEKAISECLTSLQKSSYKSCEVIVVDNGSIDGSAKRLRRKFPEITLMENETNLGFCGGNNVGIRYALRHGARYILLLNNDTIVDKDTVSKLVEAMEENPEIGAVGPKICFYDQMDVVQSMGAKIDFKTGKTSNITQDDNSSGTIKEVDFISGCALMIRREVVEKIGLLDERFFNYYEETDYCTRLRKRGYKIACIPNASLWHKGGGTKNFIIYLYFYIRNMPLFMMKHARREKLLAFFLYYYLRWTVAYSIWHAIKRKKIKEVIVITLGLLDFLFSRFGKGSLDQVIKLSN